MKILRPLTTKYKIFVSEAIWTIWKERNNRIFNEVVPNGKTLIDKWTEVISQRIKVNWNIINLKPYKERKQEIDKFESLWCTKDTLCRIDREKCTMTIIE